MPYFYRTEREIAAPAERVWKLLEDLDGYAEWNPFCPYVETDRVVGHPIVLHVDFSLNWPPLPRGKQRRQVEMISHFEPGAMLGWTTQIGPAWMFHAERLQWVEPIDADRCRYISDETFQGAIAWL